jgi:hypothetical protein
MPTAHAPQVSGQASWPDEADVSLSCSWAGHLVQRQQALRCYCLAVRQMSDRARRRNAPGDQQSADEQRLILQRASSQLWHSLSGHFETRSTNNEDKVDFHTQDLQAKQRAC